MGDLFDHVIVGGGTAAGIVAWRLIEAGRSVCVLEAGPPDRHIYHHMPAGFSKMLFDDRMTWQYASEPSLATAGRAIPIPQGRTLGGSSSVNGMAYVRGQASDFDRWAQLGNRDWAFEDVLPFFRRSEKYQDSGEDRYRGRSGRAAVGQRRWNRGVVDAIVAAAKKRGHPFNPDYNGSVQEGVGFFQSMIDRRGRRVSTATAFLHPAKQRGADVRTAALVTRLVISEGRAIGVDYLAGETQRRVLARHSVIVAAGPIGSPKLLQLSGIGPSPVLLSAGVPLVHRLAGVGENLSDHYGPRLVARLRPGVDSINAHARGLRLAGQVIRWMAGKPSILSLGVAQVHVYGKSERSLDLPDYSLHFGPLSYDVKAGGAPGATPRIALDELPGLTSGAWQMRPVSRGYVRIGSGNPLDAPVINPRYLAEDTDRRVVVAAMKEARAIMATPPLSALVESNLVPGDEVQSDDEWLDFVRRTGGTGFHLVGTCKMGPRSDGAAVVDDRLRVHGLEGLYVADSSIMPQIVSGNTVATTMMIAEKASDMIVADSRS